MNRPDERGEAPRLPSLESEAELRAILASMSEGVLVADVSGRVVHCNAAAETVTGIPRAELEGSTPPDPRWRVIQADGSPLPDDALPGAVALRTGQIVRDVLVGIRRADGTLSWVIANAVPMRRGDAATPYGAVTTLTDVTERYEQRRQLEARERSLRAYFESPGVGVAIIGADDTWTQVNDRLCGMLGYSREDLSRLTWLELTHPDDRAAHGQLPLELIAGTRDSFAIDKRYIRKDGSVVWALTSVSCARHPDGTLAERVAILKDITTRKHAEAELEATRAQLAYALDGSNDGLWDWDLASGVMRYNQRLAAMLGYDLADVDGSTAATQQAVHPDDVSRVTAARQAALDGHVAQFESEHRLRHRDGRWIWMLVRGRVVERDAAGVPLRAAGTCSDVSVRKEGEERLRIALAENERLIAQLREALDNIRTLSGLLPICMFCKKIRDDSGYWKQIEVYIATHTDTRFSHGLCPACMDEHYPEVAEDGEA